MSEHICTYCGEKFEAKNLAKYCSSKCGYWGRKYEMSDPSKLPSGTFTCTGCNSFTPINYDNSGLGAICLKCRVEWDKLCGIRKPQFTL